MEFVVKLLIGIVLLVAGFLAVVGWQSFTRGTTIARLRAPGDADGPPGPRDPLFCDTLSLLTKTAIVPGHHVEIFAENGLVVSRAFAADGGAASDLWLQIAADGLGLPVRRIDHHPGSCLGAAFVAGVGIGAIRDFGQIETYVAQGRPFRPDFAEAERMSIRSRM